MSTSPHEFTGIEEIRLKEELTCVVMGFVPQYDMIVCEGFARKLVKMFRKDNSDILSMVRNMPCLCTALNPFYKGKACPRCKILNKYNTEFIDSFLEA